VTAATEWVDNERVRVRLLGGLEVGGVTNRDLGSRKARTLLKVLALARGSSVSVDRLADVLWGDDQPARPADQVGVLVSRLRAVLGAGRIRRADAGYVLVADWLDVDELDRLAAVAAEALADGRVSVARAAAGAALALARGPLLPDDDGEWVEAERAAVRAAVTRVRRLAVDAAVAAGDHGGAAALGEQALADDPYDELVLRAVMESHLAAGRPASALAAYARVRERLAEDLGVSPTAATEALHARALAAADGDASAGPPADRTPVPLVGRARELGTLDAAFAVAAGGGVALVLIEGDAGIGKTTLVEAWSQVAGGDAVVLWGRCDPLGRDLPLQPVADALADHLRAIGGGRAAAVVGDEAATLAPLLGPLTGAPATVVVDAEAGQARVFAALVGVLSRAGSGKPVVLVIDDLHVAGASTLSWLAFARRRAQRALVVVTTRPGGARGLEPTDHIHLGPLGLDAVTELVGTARAEALYERSGGHPLLLAALAASEGEELPATLPDTVAARVDSLGDEVGATVRVAAVLGPDCDLELVAQVSGAEVVEVLGHLEVAERAGLVVERGSRFAFRHELVRAALEAATGAARRALVHQRAARALATRPRVDPLAVAVHARAGGDDALAARWFVAASEVAASRFDTAAAEDHATAALDLVPTSDAYAARARARMSGFALEAAAADAERAIALGGGAPALEVAGWVAYYRRRYNDARHYAEEAAAQGSDSAVRISALALAGRVRHGAGDLAGAVEHLTAVGDGPPAVRGVADVWLAQARVHQGRPTEALATLARPLADPDALAHPWAPLHLRFNRILALGQLGRVSDALAVVTDLDAAVARSGPVGTRFAGPAANAGAWILRWSGRTEEADARNRRALEAAGGDAGPAADAMAEAHYVALLDMADGALLGGDPAAAATLAARLAPVDTWGGTMAWHQRHRLGLLRARLALVGGDLDAAAQLASAVAADAAARGAGRYELLARAVLGLADPSVPTAELAAVVDGLARCAALDGWPLVAALAASRRSDAWWAEAERRAGAVVANAGEHASAARRFVERLLRA
jgi:DNA-binding SARP family transcriptional activator/tetratricopeptide (TPR) repeat protein